MKGAVKFFNESKGFGFIAGEDSKDYFVHSSAILAGITLGEGDKVTFDVTQGDRGLKAINVALDRDVPGAPQAVPANDNEPESEDDESEDEAEDAADDAEESDDEDEQKAA